MNSREEIASLYLDMLLADKEEKSVELYMDKHRSNRYVSCVWLMTINKDSLFEWIMRSIDTDIGHLLRLMNAAGVTLTESRLKTIITYGDPLLSKDELVSMFGADIDWEKIHPIRGKYSFKKALDACEYSDVFPPTTTESLKKQCMLKYLEALFPRQLDLIRKAESSDERIEDDLYPIVLTKLVMTNDYKAIDEIMARNDHSSILRKKINYIYYTSLYTGNSEIEEYCAKNYRLWLDN